jgi:hypothetical protein
MAGAGQGPTGGGVQSINWRRFAVLGSAVITGVAVIRLIADAAGVPRGTTASAVVASASNFLMYLTLGLSAPYVIRGLPRRPLARRALVLVPIAAVFAVINFWYLQASL